LKNKIEIQILTPATREQLVELRDELRKIDGFEAFDLQLPATPLIQGKMGLELIILEAVLSGVSHFAAEKSMEECHEQISSVFNRIMRRKPREPEVEVEAMSGTMPVESDKWKYAIAENSNGTTTVTEYDNTGAVNVFSNREYSIDPEHTHVVLIGVSDYEDTANFSRIPPVAGNLDEMYSIFSDRSLVGIPFENITRLYNENCINTKDVLRKVSRTKDIRTLIIYYSGHGQNTGNNSLSLIARDTRNIDEELHNDIPYSFIDKMMNTSPADQKIIYNLVYDAQEEAFKLCKEGSSFEEIENKAREILTNGLLKLGIIKKTEDYFKYYPHGCSHHIGLDVHDKGSYGKLKKNMVITIEPGIYIPEGSDCDKKWWGIAVRIEDDLLIKEKTYELLSEYAPRKAEDVEKMVAEKSALDDFKLPALKSAKKGF